MAGRQLALRPAQAWQQWFGPKAPAPNPQVWNAVATSQNGAIIVGVEESGYIWLSITFGAKWTQQTSAGSREWTGVAISSNGQVIIASFAGNGTPGSAGIAVTNNMGVGWRFPTLPFDMTNGLKGGGSVAISGSGVIMAYADAEFAEMYLSINSGGTFNTITPPDAGSPATTIAMSRDGSLIAAAWAPADYAVIVNGAPKKFNPDSGAVIWSGGPGDLIPLTGNTAVCVDSAGCVIVMNGTSNSFAVQKISADGMTSLWTYSNSDGPGGLYMGVDSSDNIYVAGTFGHAYPDDVVAQEATFYKISPSGSLVSTSSFVPFGSPGSGPAGDYAFEIDGFCVTPNGVAVGGGDAIGPFTSPPHGNFTGIIAGELGDTWTVDLSSLFTDQTEVNDGSPGGSDAGGIVYAWIDQHDRSGESSIISSWVCKVSSSGSMSLIHSYGANNDGGVLDVDALGNIYITLNSSSFQKMSSAGTIAWTVGTHISFGVACSDGFIYLDSVNGATKLSGADGTTVVWNNPSLAAHDVSIGGWARPQYKAAS